MAKRGPTKRSEPAYFDGTEGLIVKIGGLKRLLGCKSPVTARKIARETEGFPQERFWGRGIYGWNRLEVEAWFRNQASMAVGDE